MSWTASRWAAQQSAGSPIAKLLLYALADLADEHGECWPTQRTLCDRTELGRRAVVQHLAGLEGAGLIKRERRNDVMGRAADFFTLAMGVDTTRTEGEQDGAPHAPTSAPRAPTGAPRAHGLVHVAHMVGAPRAHQVNLLRNLPIEPKGSPAALARRSKGKIDFLAAVSALRDEVWELTPSASRSRSSKADLARALDAALKRGGEPEVIRAGVAAYFASPDATKDAGRYAKGVHRIVENDRWASFTPASAVEPVATNPAQVWQPRVKAFADGRNGFWNSTDWGPKPGRSGCEVPTAILAEFGLLEPSPQTARIVANG